MNTGTQISILIALTLAGLLFFSLAGYGIAIALFGIELGDFGNLDNYRVLQATRFVQALVTIGTFAMPALVLFKINKTPLWENQLFSKPKVLPLATVALLALSILPFIGWMAEMNLKLPFPEALSWLETWARDLEARAMEMTEAFLRVNSLPDLFINLVVIAVLPAICEELLFRGAIQKALIDSRMNTHLAVWLTAAAFSFIHMQFFGFFPRMFLGALFGYLVVWGGSLWYSVLAHFVNNAASVIVMYLIEIKYIDIEIETLGANEGDIIYVILSISIGIGLLIAYRNQFKPT